MTQPDHAKTDVAGPKDHAGLTIPDLLARQARMRGDALALSAASGAGARQRLDYRGLHRASLMAAAHLAAAGLGAGDRLGIYLTNDWALECFVGALGALYLGAVVVPLNTRSAPAELCHALTLTTPRLILRHAPDSATLEAAIALGQAKGMDPPRCHDAAAMTAPRPIPSDPQGAGPDVDALGCLLFTSGTTGQAKAVMHSHRTMIATGHCSGGALGLRAGDTYQGAFPFFTSSALNLAGMSCWVAGAGLVIEGQIDTAARLDLIRNEGTTFYHGVPSVLNFMTQTFDPARHDLRGLRVIANGGATMPGALGARIAQLWPWAAQVQIYGMTESGPAGTVLPPAFIESKAGSVGRAMAGMQIDILNEAGQPVPPGTMGEIALTGAPVALGYYRNPAATADAFDGRRIRTGDMGQLDADGFLWFGDRKKDMINRGGLKIASVAVENALYSHPDVLEAAVIAIPHPDLGEDVAAVIVAHRGKAGPELADALQALCRAALADYAVPRRILFQDSLPRNPMGKILKSDLRRALGDALTDTPAKDRTAPGS
jgi:acyl-CoA synthetase (AMP-forming)/AMP-acid ligase II